MLFSDRLGQNLSHHFYYWIVVFNPLQWVRDQAKCHLLINSKIHEQRTFYAGNLWGTFEHIYMIIKYFYVNQDKDAIISGELIEWTVNEWINCHKTYCEWLAWLYNYAIHRQMVRPLYFVHRYLWMTSFQIPWVWRVMSDKLTLQSKYSKYAIIKKNLLEKSCLAGEIESGLEWGHSKIWEKKKLSVVAPCMLSPQHNYSPLLCALQYPHALLNKQNCETGNNNINGPNKFLSSEITFKLH